MYNEAKLFTQMQKKEKKKDTNITNLFKNIYIAGIHKYVPWKRNIAPMETQ